MPQPLLHPEDNLPSTKRYLATFYENRAGRIVHAQKMRFEMLKNMKAAERLFCVPASHIFTIKVRPDALRLAHWVYALQSSYKLADPDADSFQFRIESLGISANLQIHRSKIGTHITYQPKGDFSPIEVGYQSAGADAYWRDNAVARMAVLIDRQALVPADWPRDPLPAMELDPDLIENTLDLIESTIEFEWLCKGQMIWFYLTFSKNRRTAHIGLQSLQSVAQHVGYTKDQVFDLLAERIALQYLENLQHSLNDPEITDHLKSINAWDIGGVYRLRIEDTIIFSKAGIAPVQETTAAVRKVLCRLYAQK